jgi:LacI family transcriptional regulator
MKLTIKDIARLCDVSVTTVSRVINNKTESIGEKTVVRVKQKIEEVGFQPNSIARSMVSGQTHTIGLVIPDVRNPFFSELARGVEDFMNNRKYGVFLCNTDSSMDKEHQYIDLMKGKISDGMIFTTQNNYELTPYFTDLLKNEYPMVLIERYIEGIKDIPGIYLDNRGGAKNLCKFILDKGHKKIACITGPKATTNARMRLNGYKDALIEADLPIQESLIVEGDYRYEGGYSCMKKLLKYRENFTAVFACNDMMAFGAYKAIEEEHLSVPDDISLAGFDNIKYPDVFKPKLTSVNLPSYDLGWKAAEMLMKVIDKEKLEQIGIEFALDVVDKGSVVAI